MSVLADCALLCVDPGKINEIWPHVEPLLKTAMLRAGEMTMADMLARLQDRRLLLWLVWDGTEIVSALVTELAETISGKVCVIVAMGGKGRERWLHLTSQLEEFARAEGCRAMRLYGRRGWKRVMRDYRETRVILEKDLIHGR